MWAVQEQVALRRSYFCDTAENVTYSYNRCAVCLTHSGLQGDDRIGMLQDIGRL